MDADPRTPGGILGTLAQRWAFIVPTILLVGLIAWLPGFADIGPVDRDEPRYAQASKQMLETGDFIDIRLGEDARHKKPIGIYWLQATSAATVGGGADAALWAYRLPSLLGALAAAVLTAVLGAAMIGRAAGLVAGLAVASLLILGVEARLAKTDAALLATLMLAQLALWQVWSARDAAEQSRWWPVFWAGLGFAILVKGPVGPALLGLTMLALVAWERRIDWLRQLRPLRGLVLTAMITAPWAVAVLIATDGAVLGGFKADAFGKVYEVHEGHGGPPGYYLLTGLGMAWPLVALVPLAALWMWRSRRSDAAKFLIAWIVPIWLLFEFAATKLPHYTMPTYPALAIAAAAAVLSLDRRRPWLVGAPLVLVLVLGSILAVAALVLPDLLGDRLPAIVAFGAALSLVLLALVWRAYTRSRFQAAGALMLGAALTLYGTIYGGLFPRLDALALSGRMAEAATTYAPCAAPIIATAGYHEPSALFLIGTETRLATAAEAAALLAAEPCALAFADDRHLAELESAATVPVRTLATIDGWRLNEGGFTTITLLGRAP